MAIITGIAIFGGVVSSVSSFMSNSSDEVLSQSANALLSGHVQIIVYDKDGNIKKYITGDNFITNNGENCIAENITGTDQNANASNCQDEVDTSGNEPYDIIAIGTGSGATVQTNVALSTFRESQKVTGTFVDSTGDAGGSVATITWLATFTATTDFVFTESGIFDTTTFSAGNMLAHKAFDTAATLTSGDTVAITWTVVVGVNS